MKHKDHAKLGVQTKVLFVTLESLLVTLDFVSFTCYSLYLIPHLSNLFIVPLRLFKKGGDVVIVTGLPVQSQP